MIHRYEKKYVLLILALISYYIAESLLRHLALHEGGMKYDLTYRSF